jgi:hypothetical protein
MNKNSNSLRLLFVVLSAILVFCLLSCETVPDERRGSLSDAMNKSKDKNTGSRAVPEEPNPGYGNDPGRVPGTYPDFPSDSANQDNNGKSLSAEPFDSSLLFWGTRAGSTFSYSGDMGKDFDLDLVGGLALPNWEGLLYAGFKTVQPVAGSALDESVSGSLLFLRLGGELRYVPFDNREYFSPYLGAGVGGFIMGWEFQNALVGGSGKIYSDSLNGAVLSAAAGVYLVRNAHISLGVSVIPEVYLFGDLTSQGFSNDYFKPYSTIKFMGELLFR